MTGTVKLTQQIQLLQVDSVDFPKLYERTWPMEAGSASKLGWWELHRQRRGSS